ncbi:hypothetical protein J1N35_019329 [Gossypium stocksii]|uniref:Uncharacterized protein n=1 Tax=Gossypium stocksii TaxID=47602 RepID=A0A9D3VRS5_9ROSI|nr:hypothetical protein J1N35_019329 [Gossypium stocksii]
MEEFWKALGDCDLAYMGFNRQKFTWEMVNFAETNIKERLDSGVANMERNRFKFKSWWILEPSCEEVIKKLWNEKSGNVLDKLEYIHIGLQRWGKNIKGERERRSKNLRERLVELDGMARDDDTLAEIIDVKLELNQEMEKEEMYWEQRARANWLCQGDKITAFFHSAG